MAMGQIDVQDADPPQIVTLAVGVESTQRGAIVGTPSYMPPEQAMGHAVDERADVYSLGAILYTLLAGEAPIAGNSAAEILGRVISSRPISLAERVPEVPGDLVRIVQKAMQVNVADRYRDAAEFAADLRRFHLGQMVILPRQDPERDPVIDAAFEQELRNRTSDALRVLAPFSLVAITAFGLIPWLYHGRFVPEDLWPRGCTVLGLALIAALNYTPAGRRNSQQMGIAVLLLMAVFFVVVNVLERNVIGWFTSSTIFLGIGCVMLPLTPRRVFMTVGPLAPLAALEGVLSHLAPLDVRFILQVSLIAAVSLLVFLAGTAGFRLRRSEFYNRYRLQQANERLARLELTASGEKPS